MRAVKISELPAYVLDRLDGKLPTCVRPTSTNPADEDAAGNLPMCGQRAAYVALTATGGTTGTTWCADCVARDGERFGWPWHLLVVDDPATDGDDVVEFVDQLAAPADPVADLAVERDRHRADADRLAVERDQLAAELSRARIELARTAGERDAARRQRDQLTEQLDAALDDRDRARAELRVEVEAHRATADRLAAIEHHADGLAIALRTLLDDTVTSDTALAVIGRCWAGGSHTGAALTAHAAGHYRRAARLAARGLLGQTPADGRPETLGEVAADLLDDDQVAADLDDRAERDYADGFGNAYSGPVEVQA